MQQKFFVDEAKFTSEYFEERFKKYHDRKDVFEVEQKNLDKEQLEWKKRHQWTGHHVAFGLNCKLFVFPGVLHSCGHTCSLVFSMLSKIVDTSSHEYGMVIKMLRSFEGYVAGGNIVAGAELLFKMVHEFSLYLMFFIHKMYFVCGCCVLYIQKC